MARRGGSFLNNQVFGNDAQAEKALSHFSIEGEMIDDLIYLTEGLPEKYIHGKNILNNIKERIDSTSPQKISFDEIKAIIEKNFSLAFFLKDKKYHKDSVIKEFREIYSELKNAVSEIISENFKTQLFNPLGKKDFFPVETKLTSLDDTHKFLQTINNQAVQQHYFKNYIDKYMQELLVHDKGVGEYKKDIDKDFCKAHFLGTIHSLIESVSGETRLDKVLLKKALYEVDSTTIIKNGNQEKEIFFTLKPETQLKKEANTAAADISSKYKTEIKLARNLAEDYMLAAFKKFGTYDFLSNLTQQKGRTR